MSDVKAAELVLEILRISTVHDPRIKNLVKAMQEVVDDARRVLLSHPVEAGERLMRLGQRMDTLDQIVEKSR